MFCSQYWMKINFKIAFLFLSFNSICLSQYDIDTTEQITKPPLINWFEQKKKIYVGGDLSLRFGNLTYAYLAPLAGYEFYKNMSAGVTAIYQLVRVNNGSTIFNESTIGGGVFMRYRPIRPLILQLEFDYLNTVNYTSAPGNRINFPVFLGGIGYAGDLGDRAYYNVMLMYDFIDNPNMTIPPIFPFAPIYLRYGMVFYLG